MNNTIYSLQYLRAIAAALVVVHHAREQISGVRELFDSPFGSAGVDIFFVISGFIMVHMTSGKRPAPLEFLIHRVARVAPLYWAFTAILATLLLSAPGAFRSTSFTTDALINSLLFLPYEWTDGRVRPLLSIGWTLNYEMFFYLVFSASLFYRNESRRLPFVATCLTALIIISEASSSLFQFHSTYISHYGSSIVLEFVAGMILAKLFRTGGFGIKSRGFVLLGSGIALFFAASLFMPEDGRLRFLYFGIPASLVVGGCLDLEAARTSTRRSKLLLLLGDTSYSLYVSHIFTLGACRAAISMTGIDISTWPEAIAFLVGSLMLCEIAGYAVYKLVERPLIRASRHVTSRLLTTESVVNR